MLVTLKSFAAAMRCAAISAAVAMAVLLCECMVAISSRDPDSNLAAFALAAQIIMFFICALSASVSCRDNPVSGGITACGVLLFIIVALSLIFRAEQPLDVSVLIAIAADSAAAAVGIILGVRRLSPDAKKLRKNIISKYRPK